MGKLVCRIELHKENGIILTVENDDDRTTQTIVMDGTEITTTVEGPDETSTITQKEDGIALKCKTFTLEAETITCTSTDETTHESGQDLKIQSSANIQVSADSDVSCSATNTTLESTSETKIESVTLTLSGSTSAELNGASITVDSTGLLDLIAGGTATLDGNIVNIKGTINAG